jgi:hypothetical protein
MNLVMRSGIVISLYNQATIPNRSSMKQVWSDERIRAFVDNAATNAWEHRRFVEIMKRIRDDYENGKTRFQDTLTLLRECREHVDDTDLPPDEVKALWALVDECYEYAKQMGFYDGNDDWAG